MRYERIGEYADLFSELRKTQIRARAVLGISEVDDAVETLFRARVDVIVSLEQLAEYARDSNDTDSEEIRVLKIKWRRDIFGSFSKKDELGKTILDAVRLIEDTLSPIARLESA